MRIKADKMLGQVKERFDQKAKALGYHLSLAVEEVPGTAEADYENVAVEYAVARSNLKLPHVVMAAGNGSVQVRTLFLLLFASPLFRRHARAMLLTRRSKLWPDLGNGFELLV